MKSKRAKMDIRTVHLVYNLQTKSEKVWSNLKTFLAAMGWSERKGIAVIHSGCYDSMYYKAFTICIGCNRRDFGYVREIQNGWGWTVLFFFFFFCINVPVFSFNFICWVSISLTEQTWTLPNDKSIIDSFLSGWKARTVLDSAWLNAVELLTMFFKVHLVS